MSDLLVTVGQATKAADHNQIVAQYATKSASETLAPTGHMIYGCTAGTNGIKLTLPAVSTAFTNYQLTFIKMDDTDSAVMIDGNLAETINGLASIYLVSLYQKVTLVCTGTAWLILQGTLIADSGWINRSDWTAVHLGTATVVYDGKSAGSWQIGELVKEATSNNTGIIVADSGTALTLWRCTGTGIWTNDRQLTGQISGVTANVNNASTDKNTDYNFYHGFAKNAWHLYTELWMSTDKTEANGFRLGIAPTFGNDKGMGIIGVDTNNLKIQLGSVAGGSYVADTGGDVNLTNQDYYYRVVVKLVI